jgi:hypothetical protein
MPVAVVDPEAYERRDLKSLEGAYIMVRPLPHGLVLRRRDKQSKMFVESNMGTQGHRKPQSEVGNRLEIETMNEWATAYDYQYCIGDHNLEDRSGNKLDLGSQLVLQTLDPKVGAEIDTILSELNDFTEDEDFTQQPSLSSQDEGTKLQQVKNTEDLGSPVAI